VGVAHSDRVSIGGLSEEAEYDIGGNDAGICCQALGSFHCEYSWRLGLPESDAATCAARMTESDLRGVDTHGIFRLPHYCQRIRAGGINLRPKVRPVRENAVTALVDGDNAMGQVVMTYATQLAIKKSGRGRPGVGRYLQRQSCRMRRRLLHDAVAHDMVGMYMTVANGNHMPPWGGVERILARILSLSPFLPGRSRPSRWTSRRRSRRRAR